MHIRHATQFCDYNSNLRSQEENSQEAAINALLDGERNAALQVAAVASASRADALKSAERQVRGVVDLLTSCDSRPTIWANQTVHRCR